LGDEMEEELGDEMEEELGDEMEEEMGDEEIKVLEAEEESANTIKGRSPFTKIFFDIYSAIKDSSESPAEVNPNYNPKIIIFLLENYMPYCFIWASLSMKDYGLSRLTNGIIEIENRTIKNQVSLSLIVLEILKIKIFAIIY
jgi:hypothetical protein